MEPVHKHTGSHREAACLQMQRYGGFPQAIFLPPITTYWPSQNSNTTPPHLVLPDAAISQVTALSMERVSENEDDTTHAPVFAPRASVRSAAPSSMERSAADVLVEHSYTTV
ncbi:hypothetical protein B0H13DRAFT_1885238 [Mycena leptocephala]|nr:hypothetical protein B0H13DRAFT_1885238 [Mycena leptocephala]